MSEGHEKKKKSSFDKILMGAVIGGAIGSVLGAAIAPKEGKKIRQNIADTVRKATKTSMKIFGKIKGFFKKKKQPEENSPSQTALTETKPGPKLPQLEPHEHASGPVHHNSAEHSSTAPHSPATSQNPPPIKQEIPQGK